MIEDDDMVEMLIPTYLAEKVEAIEDWSDGRIGLEQLLQGVIQIFETQEQGFDTFQVLANVFVHSEVPDPGRPSRRYTETICGEVVKWSHTNRHGASVNCPLCLAQG